MPVDPIDMTDALQTVHRLDRELRRVRRFATMLHDRRSIVDLTAYERELEAQLARTASGTDVLHRALRPVVDGRAAGRQPPHSAAAIGRSAA
ncbi:MAG: hypothetical protein PGN23_00100 [Sphingomonas adhaesiva]|uniref:hypothetical protein n=1 Tax=Sphingomonas adhaesiva TaxID=28212 RepID=UPI002FF5DFD7